MFERFTKEAREAVAEAERHARRLGTRTIGAEHLLLAVGDWVGIEVEAFEEALSEERRSSLASVGIDMPAPTPRPAVGGRTRFDATARLALERALKSAVARRDRHIGARHIALGALEADVGTVPRAIEHTGLDRAELRRRAG